MKGIILAGGTGTRLGNLTKVVNKHLLPIYDMPMIYFPISTLIGLGIRNIMIVTDKSRAGDFMNLLGSGKGFGCRFTYGLQDDAAGIANAISVSRDFAGRDDITVILGDNIFLGQLAIHPPDTGKAKIYLKRVSDPERFGVCKISSEGLVEDIIEKPANPVSDLAITGLYQYPSEVFRVIDSLKPSQRGELEVTDINRYFNQERKLQFEVIENEWIDAGTIDSLYRAQTLVKEQRERRDR